MITRIVEMASNRPKRMLVVLFLGVPVLAIVGDRDGEVAEVSGLEVVSLADRYGLERALAEPLDLVADVLKGHLQAR